LVFGRGRWSRAAWQMGDSVDAGNEGHKVALEPGYLGVEGTGLFDADGNLGAGGGPWEDDEDPVDMSPLSLRICEMAGDDDGNVPGVVRVGTAPRPPRLPGTGMPVPVGNPPRSQPVGMFVKSEACSSTGSITCSIVLATDDPLRAPTLTAWMLGSTVSPSPPIEPIDRRIPQIFSVVVADGNFKFFDATANDEEIATPCPAMYVVRPPPLILTLPDACASALIGRKGNGMRNHVFAPRDETDPVLRAGLKSHVFGSLGSGDVAPAAVERSVAHSEQRAVEELVRRRDPKDYAYVAGVTDLRPTGCGAVNFEKRPDALPGEPGPRPPPPPSDLLSARNATRIHETQVVLANSTAVNEDEYLLGGITRRPRGKYDDEFEALGKRKLRAAQRAAVRVQLAEIVHSNQFHAMQRRISQRKLRAKVLRLAKARSIGGRGVGDSDRWWTNRLRRSKPVEKRGVWEKRKHDDTGDFFYYNTDALADPPRLCWDAPKDVWSLDGNSPRQNFGSVHGVSVSEHVNAALKKDERIAEKGLSLKGVRFEEDATAVVIPAPPARRKRRAGLSDRGDGFGDEARSNKHEEHAAQATLDDLLHDEGFMNALTSRLGGDVQPERDDRARAAEAPPDPAMAQDPWRRTVDADARDAEWWSDESDEAGDVEDWAKRFDDRALPQDHADARDMRMLEIRESKVLDKERDAPGFVPDWVPAVPGVGELGPRGPAPPYGHPKWRRLEFHLKGRYWRVLPRIRARPGFVKRPRETVTIASDDGCWLNKDLSNSIPGFRMQGIHRHTTDDRSWGESPTDWRPEWSRTRRLPVVFVTDALDDVARVLSSTRRRMDREAHHTTPMLLVECVDRGARATTTVEERVAEDELKAKMANLSIKPKKEALIERAVFAARTANLADLEECLDTYSLDIESRDPAGNTLLCLVVQQNERGVAKYLLRRGADINAQNFVGNAPLHFAFGYSYDDLGNYLLSKGANPDLTNAKGETCYEFNKMDH